MPLTVQQKWQPIISATDLARTRAIALSAELAKIRTLVPQPIYEDLARKCQEVGFAIGKTWRLTLSKRNEELRPVSSTDEDDIQCDPATLFKSLETFMDEVLPLEGVPITAGEFIHGRMEARAKRRAATVRNVPYLHNTRARLVDTPPPNPEPVGFRPIYPAPPGLARPVPMSRTLEARVVSPMYQRACSPPRPQPRPIYPAPPGLAHPVPMSRTLEARGVSPMYQRTCSPPRSLPQPRPIYPAPPGLARPVPMSRTPEARVVSPIYQRARSPPRPQPRPVSPVEGRSRAYSPPPRPHRLPVRGPSPPPPVRVEFRPSSWDKRVLIWRQRQP